MDATCTNQNDLEFDCDISTFDLGMKKTYEDYPKKFIPTKLNPRTGKAKNCQFENLDMNLYNSEARLVAFYTTVDRIYPWIKALSVFYYDHLGDSDQLKVTGMMNPVLEPLMRPLTLLIR